MGTPDYDPLNWALTGVAGALTIGRFAIRGYYSRRLYWDDLAHLLAFVVLILHGVLDEVTNNSKIPIARATKGTVPTSEAELLHMYQTLIRQSTVKNCFLHGVFWLVKISFLLFYYRIFSTSITFKKMWWAVLAFTLLTFWVPIGGVLATCANASKVADYKACTNGNNYDRSVRLKYSCAMNVASDLAIMALPLWMIKDLKITKYQKLGLALIFSLAGFCVAFDIVRTVQSLAQKQALYTVLEINLFVVVSCLPTYRALLNISRQRSSNRPTKLSTWTTIENGKGKEESEVPLTTKGIHVTNAYLVSNEERVSPSVETPGATSRDHILPPEPAHTTRSRVLPPYSSPV